MGLAIGRAHAGAGAATDTGALVVHHHHFLLDLVVLVVIEVDEITVLADALQRHDIAAADLVAAAAADAFLRIDRDQIIRLPIAPVACRK